MKPSLWGETFFSKCSKNFSIGLMITFKVCRRCLQCFSLRWKKNYERTIHASKYIQKKLTPTLTPLRYNLGDLNLWCQRVCHLMIRRECLKKVLLCNMLRFPTIQFVHMQAFATTSCQIQNDALQFFINSVDWRLHSDNFKFSYICAHLHINKKWKIDKMIHGRQL